MTITSVAVIAADGPKGMSDGFIGRALVSGELESDLDQGIAAAIANLKTSDHSVTVPGRSSNLDIDAVFPSLRRERSAWQPKSPTERKAH